MSDVTNDGELLIKQWMKSVEAEKAARRALNSAECSEANASNALGKWLMPNDTKPGEKFSVWYGDSLIEVSVTNGDPVLRIRNRGKSLLCA